MMQCFYAAREKRATVCVKYDGKMAKEEDSFIKHTLTLNFVLK